MSTPLLANILNQPAAIQAVAEYQLGPGVGALTRAAALLQSRKRVLLSGMGASYFACTSFQYLLAARGFSVHAIETAELLYFLPSLIDRHTALVLVSRSGESVEVTKLLSLLRERGAAVIGVVNVPGSALSSAADETIVIGSPADQLVAIQTYTGTLAAFALLVAAASNELDQAGTELGELAGVLSHWLPECVSASQGWTDFLHHDGPLYLLGRGPALGSVAEGVLLMHETAKAPAVGMSVAQFRHGPVEVVDENFRGVVIGTQPATAELDLALAHDVARMGGQVRWLGPEAADTNEISLGPWPSDIPERFTAIAETIPLQMAAYRKAEVRGVRPGEFRWAPLVTTAEAGFFMPTGQ